jgi:hypothetical protein
VQVRHLLPLSGQALPVELVRSTEGTAPRLEQAGQTYYRKAAMPGHDQTPAGEGGAPGSSLRPARAA